MHRIKLSLPSNAKLLSTANSDELAGRNNQPKFLQTKSGFGRRVQN